jgi:hypothetical protein
LHPKYKQQALKDNDWDPKYIAMAEQFLRDAYEQFKPANSANATSIDLSEESYDKYQQPWGSKAKHRRGDLADKHEIDRYIAPPPAQKDALLW